MPVCHAAWTRNVCPGSYSCGSALVKMTVAAHAPVATTVASTRPANNALARCFIERLLVVEVLVSERGADRSEVPACSGDEDWGNDRVIPQKSTKPTKTLKDYITAVSRYFAAGTRAGPLRPR